MNWRGFVIGVEVLHSDTYDGNNKDIRKAYSSNSLKVYEVALALHAFTRPGLLSFVYTKLQHNDLLHFRPLDICEFY
jgi:hypothetical protein